MNMRMKKLFFVMAIACAMTAGAAAQDHQKHDKHDKGSHQHEQKTKGEFLGKGDGVNTCPVTGEEIKNKDIKADFYGRTVYFCCPGCEATAKAKPEAYIKKTFDEQVAATKNLAKPADDHHGDHKAADGKFIGKGDGIETCPVTGEPVNKNLKGEANGRTFYVCCEGCLDTVKKNPDAYLKKQ